MEKRDPLYHSWKSWRIDASPVSYHDRKLADGRRGAKGGIRRGAGDEGRQGSYAYPPQISDISAIRGTPFGFAGVFCDVLEFCKTGVLRNRWADADRYPRCVGVCQIQVQRKKSVVFALYDTYGHAVSGHNGVKLSGDR